MTPKYQSVAAELRRAIIDGSLAPGDRLPGIKEMIKRYSLSSQTARAVFRLLADEGLVYTKHGGIDGGGTFVIDRAPIAFCLDRQKLLPGLGPWESACATQGITGRVIPVEVAVQTPPEDIARSLGLRPGDKAVRRTRHALTGKQPDEQVEQIQNVWYPHALVAGSPIEQPAKLIGGEARALRAIGVAIARVSYSMQVRRPTPEEAEQLTLYENIVTVVSREAQDSSGNPVEFWQAVATPRTVFKTEALDFRVEFAP